MELLRLEGRTAAVTGARGGLGTALADALEKEGATVDRISRGMLFAPQNYELLFLNAAFGMIHSAGKRLEAFDFQEMVQVNLIKTIEDAQLALDAGAIHVHVVGSIVGLVGSPLYGLYGATKAGLRNWAYAAAREMPGRVSISHCNGIRTNYFNNLRGDKDLLAYYGAQVEAAQHTYDSPEEVAEGILDGIQYGAREIIPTAFAEEWILKNVAAEDVSRMWAPGMRRPSIAPWDWHEHIAAYYAAVNAR
jgi:short-subunit dehydrogenase